MVKLVGVCMATKIYEIATAELIDGTVLEVFPLKIKYMREFMAEFEKMKSAKDDYEAMNILVECTRIAMKQFYPKLSKSIKDVENNIDMPNVYKIVNAAANIKVDEKSEESVKKQATDSGSTWENLDLAKLESEVFLLGIWKDYHELENSLSMPELVATLSAKRELDYDEKKFNAAIQGIDLDKESGNSRGQKEWEDMKARVFSKGKTSDSNDILALQGQNAQKYGFGIGMGLDYEDLTK
jgi:hypothetical protein